MHHKESRATLGGKLSAVLVAAGSSVGLGNIWRFPYVAGDNGGGAFLIIYILCVLLLGLPLMIAIVSSLNMKKMLRDNVLVRKLVGIETAGSLNLLFTDKTGTITKGKLEVVRFITLSLIHI